MGYIYKITNKINGKVYIGKTKNSVHNRFKQHLRCAQKGTNRYLYDAMNHYGYDTFEVEVLEEAIPSELSNLERYYIKKFDSLNPLNGYNMTEGGEYCDTISNRSPEANAERSRKISAALRGKKQPRDLVEKRRIACTGKKRSLEVRKQMSESRKGRIPWNKGKKMSEASIEKLRLANLGKKQSEYTKNKRSQKISELRWFNNGTINIRAEICPEGYVKGRVNFKLSKEGKLNASHTGTHWFTNGSKNIMAKECPPGFYPGRTRL